MLNRKGIISFLLITFGITYLIEGILILSGFRVTLVPAVVGQYTIMIAMWVPALATFITTRFITKEKLSSTLFSFGPSIKPYLFSALVIPVVFIITYLLTWALGLGKPDWQLTSFFELIASTGADMSTAPSPGLILLLLFVISFIRGALHQQHRGIWRGMGLARLSASPPDAAGQMEGLSSGRCDLGVVARAAGRDRLQLPRHARPGDPDDGPADHRAGHFHQ